MPDPIKIELNIEAQKAVESLQAVIDASAQNFAQTYSASVDKVQSKIDELTRKQNEHRAVIEANGKAVAELGARQASATEAELVNLQAEINKYQQLTRSRELDILKIDETKAKLAEKASFASDATDREKLAVRYLTEERMIELKGLQDSIKAHAAVKDVGSDTYKKLTTDLAALTAEQSVHSQAIEAARQKIEELNKVSGNKSVTGDAEQQSDSLRRSIAYREQEVVALEMKKAKLSEVAALSQATSDGERHEIRMLFTEQQAYIASLDDLGRAANASRDIEAGEAEQRLVDLAKLTRQQEVYNAAIALEAQQVRSLESQATGASAAIKEGIDRQIASIEKSIASHKAEQQAIEAKKIKIQEAGELAAATSDSEREKIQQNTTSQLAAIQAVSAAAKALGAAEQGSSSTAAEGIAKVVAQRKVYSAVIDADKKKLTELEEQQAAASGDEEKQIAQQVTSMKKIISARQDDILSLDAKRIKLEEIAALENATSEAEEEDIRKSTSARLAEVEALRDITKAQNSVRDAQAESTNALSEFMGKAGGLIGIAGTVAAVQQAFAAIGRVMHEDAEIMQRMYDAATHFRDENKGIYESARPFFNAAGISDPKAQQAAEEVLYGKIAPTANLPQSNVVEAATGLAPYLKQAGINPQDKQFADLVGTTAQFQYRGLDSQLTGNFVGQQLKENAKLSGDDVNKSLSNLVATAGSPQFANELMTALQEQKAKAGAAGFNLADMQKVWLAAGDAGIAPEQRGAVSKQYFQSLDRWVGQSPQQIEEQYEKGNDFNPGQLSEIDALKKAHRTPAQLLRTMTKMQHGGVNLHPLDDYLVHEAETGQGDIKQLAGLTDDLDQTAKERFFRGEGGSRASASVMAVTGWQNRQLPTASPTDFQAGDQQKAQAAQELATYKGATGSPTSAGLAGFQTASDEIEKYLDNNPMLKGGLYSPDSARGRLLSDGQREMWSGGATPKMESQRIALADAMYSLAQQAQDMDDGKLPNDTKKRAQIDIELKSLGGMLPMKWDSSKGMDHQPQIPMMALENGKQGDLTRKQALQDYKDRYKRYELFRDGLDYRTSGSSVNPPPDFLTPQTAGDAMDNAARAARAVNPAWTPSPNGAAQPRPAGPPAPAAPSGPVSVNYNIRHTSYGYQPDSLGSINQPNNNYG